jgi:hypothetical protein
MSATTDSEPLAYTCNADDCSAPRPRDGVEGGYCSRECYDRSRGRDHIRRIKHDHRFCAACFRKKKEIEKPPASAPSVVVGFQYLTPNAEPGQHARQRRDADTDHPADRVVIGAAECTCGTVDHRDEWAREEHITSIRDAAERLIGILARQRREGQHEHDIDAKTLVETLTETTRADGTPDWALAVGRAIIDD